jgi:4-hydroxybenzoate polyprenyltransferase
MSVRGIYRILRLPLFVTAVADITAGYTVAILCRGLAFDWRLAALLGGTSAGLYLFGMVQNDLVDIRRDRLLKVRRPLVTGKLGIGTAVVLLILTGGLAAVCAVMLSVVMHRGGALTLAIGTFAAINLYNLAAKRGPPYVATTVMGLCRFLNFGIGVAAAVGVPRRIGLDLLHPSGPLWVRHGLALFFAAMVAAGYSICARRGTSVSTRPWSVAFVVAAAAGFGMIAISVAAESPAFAAPVARVFAALLLAGLWPGGLWSAAGPARKPRQYEPFIERMLYWLIAMDAAFVFDAWLMTR